MIALLGGTFDPIHDGHLLLARCLLADYDISRLYLVPAYRNPLKGPAHTSGEARLEMVRLAVTEVEDPRLGVLDWEVKAAGPSYTLATIEKLLPQLNESMTLVLGNEVFASLPRWHEPGKIVSLVDIIVIPRVEGVPFRPREVLASVGVRDVTVDGERAVHSGGTRWIERKPFTALPFSSTEIRRALFESRRPEGLRQSVWRYIVENRLYTAG